MKSKRDKNNNLQPSNNEAQSKQKESTNAQMQQQLSQNDWEWEKDNYLIKDIRDLIADSNQVAAAAANTQQISNNQQPQQPMPPPFLAVPSSKIENKRASAEAKRTKDNSITEVVLRPPPPSQQVNSQLNVMSQGSFRGTPRDDTASPNRNRVSNLPPNIQQQSMSTSQTNFRHTSSSGQMYKQPRGLSDLKPPPSKKVDPVMQQIADQSNHAKHQQKTQEEFLYQYIKEFQDAIAGKEQFKRQQMHQEMVNQQKRSRRGGAGQQSNNGIGGASMGGEGMFTMTSSVQQHERNANVKSEMVSQSNTTAVKQQVAQRRIGGNQRKEPTIVDKGWFGITLKVDDKSGFKGHKHLIDKQYPPQQNVNSSVQYVDHSTLFDDSINQKSNNLQTEFDQNQPSKAIEDSYLYLENNPMITVEDENQQNDEFGSFDNRGGESNAQEGNAPLNSEGTSILPRIAPENTTIQSAGAIEEDDENLPPINFLPSQESKTAKYQTQGQGFFSNKSTVLSQVRQSNKFHKRTISNKNQEIQQPQQQDDPPRLLKRRKSNFISVENQLQQTLQEIEDLQTKKQQAQNMTGRAAFISKNLAALHNNPLGANIRGAGGYSSGINNSTGQASKFRHDYHQQQEHSNQNRYIGSGGMAIENMSRTLQDPLFDENINNASLSMSVKSHVRGSQYYNRQPTNQDDLIMSMSETLDQHVDTHLPSLGLKSNKTPLQQQQSGQNRKIFRENLFNTEKNTSIRGFHFVRDSQKFSIHKGIGATAQKKRQDSFIGGADYTQKLTNTGKQVAHSSRVSPGRTSLIKPINKNLYKLDHSNSFEQSEYEDFNDYLPMPMDDGNDEILASASMVSSGGFIGDQFHQRQVKQRWKHLESFTNKEVTMQQINQKIDIKKQPKQFAPISKTNVEWNKQMKETTKSNIFKKGLTSVELDQSIDSKNNNNIRMKSTNFDSTHKSKANNNNINTNSKNNFSQSLNLGKETNNSMFKSKNSQGLIPMRSTQISEPSVIKLEKVKVNHQVSGSITTPPADPPKPFRTFSQEAMERLSRPVVHKSIQEQPLPVLKINRSPIRSPRPTTLVQSSPNNKQNVQDDKASDEGKGKENTLADISLMKNSTSGTNLINNGRKSPIRASPSRVSQISPRLYSSSPGGTMKSANVHRAHANESLMTTNFKKGVIIDFDVEHLLHPLRQICAKKMLCSCNAHKPRERTVSPKKSPREHKPPKEEKLFPRDGKLEKQPESPAPTKPVVQTAEKSIETIERQEVTEVAKMLNDVEWKETPIFKQHFNIKVTEMESLKGTRIGIRRYQELAKTKGKTMGQIALDLKDEKLRRQLLDQALKNVYMEPECEYLKKITLNYNLNDAQMAIVYEKALDTLEVLMIKFGLDEPFQRVNVHYESIKTDNLRMLLIKVLTRCLVMYDSLSKIEVIFKLMRKRAEHEQKFQDFDKNWMTDKKFLTMTQEEKDRIFSEKLKTLEQDVAQYCYQSCRLWVQISAFTFDHSLLNEFTFKFGGPEYQPLIRKQVEQVRAKFGKHFGFDKIPLMDEDGRLYYDPNEGVPPEYVRVGGGFQLSSGNNSQTNLQRQSSLQRSPSQSSSLNDGRGKLNSSALLQRVNSSKLDMQRQSSLSKKK